MFQLSVIREMVLLITRALRFREFGRGSDRLAIWWSGLQGGVTLTLWGPIRTLYRPNGVWSVEYLQLHGESLYTRLNWDKQLRPLRGLASPSEEASASEPSLHWSSPGIKGCLFHCFYRNFYCLWGGGGGTKLTEKTDVSGLYDNARNHFVWPKFLSHSLGLQEGVHALWNPSSTFFLAEAKYRKFSRRFLGGGWYLQIVTSKTGHRCSTRWLILFSFVWKYFYFG